MDFAEIGYRVDTRGIRDGVRELDRLDGTARRAEGGARGAGAGMGAAGLAAGSMSKAMGALGSVVAGIGFASLATATGTYGQALAQVSTLVDTSVFDMERLSDEAKRMAGEYGSMPTEQAEAFYQAISAGATTAEKATALMDTANRLAIGGATDVLTAVDGLSSTMNAYGESAGSATDVSDAFFVAVKAGKTTVGELAGSIGNVAPIANTAGVSMETLLAATAALTSSGQSTSEAMTGLRGIIAAVINPSKEAEKTAYDLGLEFDTAAIKSKGFAGFIADVGEKTGWSEVIMAKLFGRVDALGPMMALTGESAEKFEGTLAEMGDRAGNTDEAFGKMSTSASEAGRIMGGLMAGWLGLTEGIDKSLTPFLVTVADNVPKAFEILEGALGDVANAYDVFMEKLNGATNPFGGTTQSMDTLYVVLRNVRDTLGPLVPYLDDFAIAALAIGATAGGLALAGAALGAIAAVALSPITLGIAAVAAGAVLIRENWDGIAAWWSGVWDGIRGEAESFGEWWSGATVADIGRAAVSVLGAFASLAIDGAAMFVTTLGESIRARVSSIEWPTFSDLLQGAAAFARGMGELGGELIGRLVTALSNSGSIADAIEWPTLGDLARGAVGFIQGAADLATVVIGGLRAGFAAGLARLPGEIDWPSAADIGAAAGSFVGGFASLAIDAMLALTDKLSSEAEGINWAALAADLARGAATMLGGLVSAVGEGVAAFARELGRAMGDVVPRMLERIPLVGDGLADKYRRSMEEVGEDVAGGYAEGMKSGEKLIVAAAESMGSLPAYIVRETMEIRSPSRVMIGLGENVTGGYAEGIKGGGDVVAQASVAVADRVVQSFSVMDGALEDQFFLLEDGSSKARGYFDEWNSGADTVKAVAKKMDDASIIAGEYSGDLDAVAAATFRVAESTRDADGKLSEYGERQERIGGVLRAISIEQKALRIELEQGAHAADVYRHTTEGYELAQAEAAVSGKENAEALRYQIQSIEDLSRGIASSILDASSLKNAFENIGGFMRDWLKGLIEHFLKNKITAYVTSSIGGGGGGGGGGILDGIGSMLGGLFGGGGPAGVGGRAAQPNAGGALSGAASAAGGLAGVAGALGSIVPQAALVVGGLTVVQGLLGSTGGLFRNMGESIRVMVEEVPKAAASLDDVRVNVGNQLTALGVDITTGFDERVTNIFAAAIDDIDYGVSAENLQDGIVHFTGRAYGEALAELDPRVGQMIFDSIGLVGFTMEEVLSRAADLTEEEVQRIGAAFDGAAETIGTLVPLLSQTGAMVGTTAEEMMLSSLELAEAMGGASEAAAGLTFFLDNIVPASERAALALDMANDSIYFFNDSLDEATRVMYGGADGIINTSDELYNLFLSLGYTGEAAADAAAEIYGVAPAIAAVEAERERERELLEGVGDALRGANAEFDATAPGALAAADALVELTGGLGGLQAETESFYQNFYTEAERSAIATDDAAANIRYFNQGIMDMGYSAVTSKEGLRELWESLDKTTVEGARLAAAVLAVDDSFVVLDAASQAMVDSIKAVALEAGRAAAAEAEIRAEARAERVKGVIAEADAIGDAIRAEREARAEAAAERAEYVLHEADSITKAMEIESKARAEAVAERAEDVLREADSITRAMEMESEARAEAIAERAEGVLREADSITRAMEMESEARAEAIAERAEGVLREADSITRAMEMESEARAEAAAERAEGVIAEANAIGDAARAAREARAEATAARASSVFSEANAIAESARAAAEHREEQRIKNAEMRREQMQALDLLAGASRDLGLQFDATVPKAGAAARSLIDLMGGMDALTSATDKYYQEFYSEAERTALESASAAAEVRAWNSSLNLTAEQLKNVKGGTIDTKSEFRNYVESLDLQTKAGQRAYAVAMNLQDSFIAVADSEGSLDQMIKKLPPELRGTFEQMVTDAEKTAGKVPAELQSGYDGMVNGANEAARKFPVGFLASLEHVVKQADGSGRELSGALADGFSELLSDAGVTADQLPPHLRRGYEQMQSDADKAARGLPTGLVASLNHIVEQASGSGKNMAGALAEGFDSLLDDAGVAADKLPPHLQRGYEQMQRDADNAARGLPVGLTASLNHIVEQASGSGKNMAGALTEGFEKILDNADITADQLPPHLQRGYEQMQRDADNAARGLPIGLTASLNYIVEQASGSGKNMAGALAEGFEKILDNADITADQLPPHLQRGYEQMQRDADNAARGLPVGLTASLNHIVEQASGSGKSMAGALAEGFGKLLDSADITADQLPPHLQRAYEQMQRDADNAARGLPVGLTASLSYIVEQASGSGKGMAGALAEGFDKILKDAGVAADQLPPHLQRGYEQMQRDADNAARGLPVGLSASLTHIIEQADSSGRQMSGALKEGFDKLMADAGVTAKDLPPAIRRGYEDMVRDANAAARALPIEITASLKDIVKRSDGASGEMKGYLLGAFDDILTDAGITADDLPPKLRRGYRGLVDGAEEAAIDLIGSGEDMRDDIGSAADSLGRIADTLVAVFGDIGEGAGDAALAIEAASVVIGRSSNTNIQNARESSPAYNDAYEHLRRLQHQGYLAQQPGSTVTAPTRAQFNVAQGRVRREWDLLNRYSAGLDRVSVPEMPALIHLDETVLRADVARAYRALGGTATMLPSSFKRAANVPFRAPVADSAGDGGSRALVSEFRAAREELAAMRRENAAMAREAQRLRSMIVGSTQEQTDEVKAASRRARLSQRQLGKAIAS